MTGEHDPSLEVLVERFIGFEKLVRQRFDNLEAQIKAMDFVHLSAYVADHTALVDRMQRIEDEAERRDERMSRLFWAVFSALVAPIIVGVVVYLLVGSG